jgi:hypothetical protein
MALGEKSTRMAKPNVKASRVRDGGALYLWVTPAGAKLWRRACEFDGKEQLDRFAHYPDRPLAMAREQYGEAANCWAQTSTRWH